MKNIAILIFVLFSLQALSQTTNITKLQKERIKAVFTPAKIIDISKAISNEERQAKEIDSLHAIIDFKENVIEELKKEHLKTLVEIAKYNETAKETTEIVDDISDNQLKKERNRWKGLHLYAGVETPKFEFTQIYFNTELMYELEKFEFGLKGEVSPSLIPESTEYEFTYFLKLRYKFF